MKGGTKVLVEPHRHEGVFVARGKEDALVTLNSTPGVAVYGEKRISIEVPPPNGETVAQKVEYRVWNPFRSKRKLVACSVVGRADYIHLCSVTRIPDTTSRLSPFANNHSRGCRLGWSRQHLDQTG
jgi:rRNA 2'-O-methyltransferase fibrillarin